MAEYDRLGSAIAAIALILLIPAHANATPEDDIARGQQAFENGNKALSFQLALRAAHAGYVPAFVTLGTHYIMGIGTVKAPSKGVYWFKKAAEAGDSFGQYQLAIAYLKGDGVAQDLSSALRWADASANGNHAGAVGLAARIREKLGPDGASCASFGFPAPSSEFSQCLMQIDQARQQAQFAQQQYELQVQQYQQQVAAYQAQQEAIRKERERQKWAAVAAFGFGMAGSSSPTFGGGMADGYRAMNGQPPLAPPVAPVPPAPQNYTVRLPNGDQVYCNYNSAASYMSCR